MSTLERRGDCGIDAPCVPRRFAPSAAALLAQAVGGALAGASVASGFALGAALLLASTASYQYACRTRRRSEAGPVR